MVHINISVSGELHKKAKSIAALKGITLKEFIINSINKEVYNNEKNND